MSKSHRWETIVFLKKLLVFATLFWCSSVAWCGHTLMPHEQNIFETWLVQHPTYRAATDGDCDCAEDIRQMRTGYGGNWPKVPDYHPYGLRVILIVVVHETSPSL
jgi:hypothetical protein